MKSITLPILWNNPETSSLQDLGLEIDIENIDTRDVIFFNVSAIVHNKSYEGKNYTNVMCNGENFICVLPISEVKSLIETYL